MLATERDEAQAALATAESALAQANERIASLESAITAHESTIADHSKQQQTLRDEQEMKMSDIQLELESLREAASKSDGLNADLTIAQRERDQIQQECEMLRNNVDKLEGDLQQSKSELNEKNRNIDQIQTKCKSTESDLELANNEMKELGEQLISLKRQLKESQQQLQQQQQQINNTTQLATAASTSVTSANERVSRAVSPRPSPAIRATSSVSPTQLISSSLENKNDIESEIETLKHDYDMLQETTQDITEQLHETRVERDSLTERLLSLQERHSSELETIRQKHANDVKLLDLERDELMNYCEEQDKVLGSLQNDKRALQQRINVLSAQCDLDGVNRDLATVQQELTEINQKIETANARKQQLMEEIASIEQEIDRLESQKETQESEQRQLALQLRELLLDNGMLRNDIQLEVLRSVNRGRHAQHHGKARSSSISHHHHQHQRAGHSRPASALSDEMTMSSPRSATPSLGASVHDIAGATSPLRQLLLTRRHDHTRTFNIAATGTADPSASASAAAHDLASPAVAGTLVSAVPTLRTINVADEVSYLRERVAILEEGERTYTELNEMLTDMRTELDDAVRARDTMNKDKAAVERDIDSVRQRLISLLNRHVPDLPQPQQQSLLSLEATSENGGGSGGHGVISAVLDAVESKVDQLLVMIRQQQQQLRQLQQQIQQIQQIQQQQQQQHQAYVDEASLITVHGTRERDHPGAIPQSLFDPITSQDMMSRVSRVSTAHNLYTHHPSVSTPAAAAALAATGGFVSPTISSVGHHNNRGALSAYNDIVGSRAASPLSMSRISLHHDMSTMSATSAGTAPPPAAQHSTAGGPSESIYVTGWSALDRATEYDGASRIGAQSVIKQQQHQQQQHQQPYRLRMRGNSTLLPPISTTLGRSEQNFTSPVLSAYAAHADDADGNRRRSASINSELGDVSQSWLAQHHHPHQQHGSGGTRFGTPPPPVQHSLWNSSASCTALRFLNVKSSTAGIACAGCCISC
ncbi:hypothetical protein GQ42DRAFT_9351 [Ramicandelaber brevisporus]|nr:hypothetical protein GQ42DRAFT_9351 [Ramicandelaber brevisporus]